VARTVASAQRTAIADVGMAGGKRAPERNARQVCCDLARVTTLGRQLAVMPVAVVIGRVVVVVVIVAVLLTLAARDQCDLGERRLLLDLRNDERLAPAAIHFRPPGADDR
jgi:hypothetical protein